MLNKELYSKLVDTLQRIKRIRRPKLLFSIEWKKGYKLCNDWEEQ